MIDSDTYKTTVKTLEDSRFLVIYRQKFMEAAKEYPEILLHMCEVLVKRLRSLQKRVKE